MTETTNLGYWEKLKQPPKWALREIAAGRLRGKTDINPQWRYQAMTEAFGPCGIGWRYEVVRVWDHPTVDSQVMAFAEIHLYIKVSDEWSHPIPGVGGSMLVAKEKGGPYASDECYKMAITDALSVALKMLGVASDVYAGRWDGSKYLDTGEHQKETTTKPKQQQGQNEPTPKRKMFLALQAKGLTEAEITDLASFVRMCNAGELTGETMLEVATRADAYINEWKTAKQEDTKDIPFE